MNFKTDENLPIEVANLLREYGHNAMSVTEQQLSGHPDTDVAEVCRLEKRVLVTLDLDFADIRAYPPENYPGIIVLRPGLQSIEAILRLLERAIQMLLMEPLQGRLWIVNEQRYEFEETETMAHSYKSEKARSITHGHDYDTRSAGQLARPDPQPEAGRGADDS